MDEAPSFPAGEFQPLSTKNPEELGSNQIEQWIKELEAAPVQIRAAVDGLDETALDTKYRNWTVRQIVHHLADSHINCYVRFKWSLTEETPKIKSYDETAWSEVVDAREVGLECSLTILDGIHGRWGALLRRLTNEQWQSGFFHPEPNCVVSLIEALPSYVWHTKHHLAQIAWLRQRHRW